MDTVTSHAISLIEANYDLESEHSQWLDNLVEVGATTFDQGLGFSLDEYEVVPRNGGADVHVRDLRALGLPADYSDRYRETLSLLPPEMVADTHPPGYAGTWTEISKDYPEQSQAVLDAFGYSDMLGILAADPNGVGIRIVAPLPEVTRIAARSRVRWKMLGAHMASAYRLRQALREASAIELGKNGHADRAEAILDADGFRIVHAKGAGQEPSAAEVLRRAARRVDRARSKLKKEDPEKALQTWHALVFGRWSLVDWFDTDDRRFVLAIPNPPDVWDPRGLSEQESQVATYAALGESNKLIAYRIGLSQSRVSTLLRSAMQKLGVRNRVQLAKRLPPMAALGDLSGSVA